MEWSEKKSTQDISFCSESFVPKVIGYLDVNNCDKIH